MDHGGSNIERNNVSFLEDDFDLDIDFETAYQLVNDEFDKFDPTNGLPNVKLTEMAMSPTTAYIESVLRADTTSPKVNVASSAPFGSNTEAPELLTSLESNVIQSFLDSLMDSNVESNLQTLNDISFLYVAKKLEIPNFKVLDHEIPDEILKDPIKLKKWKHVNIEKQRRDFIKQSFDDLIKMSSLGSDLDKNNKRVPKHTSLRYILNDIKSLMKANEQLETMIKNGLLGQ